MLVGRLSHLFSFCLLLLRDQHCFTSYKKRHHEDLPDRLLDIMLEAFQEDGELSLKKFPELAQLRQAVKFLALDLGTNPVSTTKPDSTTKVQQPLDWGDDESFLFEFCRCVFVFFAVFCQL